MKGSHLVIVLLVVAVAGFFVWKFNGKAEKIKAIPIGVDLKTVSSAKITFQDDSGNLDSSQSLSLKDSKTILGAITENISQKYGYVKTTLPWIRLTFNQNGKAMTMLLIIKNADSILVQLNKNNYLMSNRKEVEALIRKTVPAIPKPTFSWNRLEN